MDDLTLDFGVKTAALAAFGDMVVALGEDAAPFEAGWRGVKEGESTLKRFLTFSDWAEAILVGSCWKTQPLCS